MATNQTNASIANDVSKPTRKELIDYVLAVHILMSQRLVCIKGYKPTKFEIMDCDCDYDDDTIIEFTEIVDKFNERYPKISI